MGLFDRLFAEVHVPGADGVRILDIPSAMNLRELGNWPTPDGPTQLHRFLRCGSTRCLGHKDRAFLRDYGLTHVLDLRGSGESPQLTCVYAHEKDVTWKNVPLFGQNLSDPALIAAQGNLDYLAGSYLRMLDNHEAVRQVVQFLALVPHQECALFHCAAGMDRTGVTAMLLLGCAGVSRQDVVRDYLYSFAPVPEVDQYVLEDNSQDKDSRLYGRARTIGGLYDAVISSYGTFAAYLLACGLTEGELELLRARLLT